MTSPDAALIAQTMDTLLQARAAEASICPSEVARAIAPDHWRTLMPQVRAVAAVRAIEGAVRITQGDTVIDPHAVLNGTVRGPLRLRRP